MEIEINAQNRLVVSGEGNTVQLAVSEKIIRPSSQLSRKPNTSPHEYDATRPIMTHLMASNYGTNREARSDRKENLELKH